MTEEEYRMLQARRALEDPDFGMFGLDRSQLPIAGGGRRSLGTPNLYAQSTGRSSGLPPQYTPPSGAGLSQDQFAKLASGIGVGAAGGLGYAVRPDTSTPMYDDSAFDPDQRLGYQRLAESIIGSSERPELIRDGNYHHYPNVGTKWGRYYDPDDSFMGTVVGGLRSLTESPIGQAFGLDRTSRALSNIDAHTPGYIAERNRNHLQSMRDAGLFSEKGDEILEEKDRFGFPRSRGWDLGVPQGMLGPTILGSAPTTEASWDWGGATGPLGVGSKAGRAYEIATGAYPGWYSNYAEAQKIAENLANEGLSTASVSDQRKGALASEHMNLGQKILLGSPGIPLVVGGQIVDEKDFDSGLEAGIANTAGWFGGMPEGTQPDAYMGLVSDALAANNPERLASLNASIPEMVSQVDTFDDMNPFIADDQSLVDAVYNPMKNISLVTTPEQEQALAEERALQQATEAGLAGDYLSAAISNPWANMAETISQQQDAQAEAARQAVIAQQMAVEQAARRAQERAVVRPAPPTYTHPMGELESSMRQAARDRASYEETKAAIQPEYEKKFSSKKKKKTKRSAPSSGAGRRAGDYAPDYAGYSDAVSKALASMRGMGGEGPGGGGGGAGGGGGRFI